MPKIQFDAFLDLLSLSQLCHPCLRVSANLVVCQFSVEILSENRIKSKTIV